MAFGPYRTYYRIVGEPSKTYPDPVVLLHGGPGSTHNYFEVLDPLADEGIQLIMYDQLGCGLSYVDGHPELWKMETWVEELSYLTAHLHLSHFHLLGQSFGGMLALAWTLERGAKGLRSLILSSTLSSSALWGEEQHKQIKRLSLEDQEAIADAEATGDFASSRAQEATAHFMERFCAGPVGEDNPECLRRKSRKGSESYLVAWGPNEFTPSGTLKDFDVTARLGEIQVPALVLHGSCDLCTDRVAQVLTEGIPKTRLHRFEGARHSCFVERNEAYCDVLRQWLEKHSGSFDFREE